MNKDMRIGILTFHRSINYGAFMQCYALTRELQHRYGDIVEVIDFEKLSKYKGYAPALSKTLRQGTSYNLMYKRFLEDLSLLPLSPKTLITEDYSQVIDYINGRYDIVIVGSDAVWAYNKNLGVKNPYWLGDVKCKKMSYAASAYSLDVKNVTAEEKKYISKCLEGYSYIGVRDQETCNFVKSLNPAFEVHRNCDPTVLLPKPNSDMARNILNRLGVDTSKRIVSFMIAGCPYIDVIEKELGDDFEYVMLYKRNHSSDRFKRRREHFLSNLSPIEWYVVYAAFYINITHFFHGTLLALRSDVPTLSFDTTCIDYDYMSKIRQILTDLNLDHFWFDRRNCKKEEVVNAVHQLEENHDRIQSLIAEGMENERKKSVSFFSALDGIMRMSPV